MIRRACALTLAFLASAACSTETRIIEFHTHNPGGGNGGESSVHDASTRDAGPDAVSPGADASAGDSSAIGGSGGSGGAGGAIGGDGGQGASSEGGESAGGEGGSGGNGPIECLGDLKPIDGKCACPETRIQDGIACLCPPGKIERSSECVDPCTPYGYCTDSNTYRVDMSPGETWWMPWEQFGCYEVVGYDPSGPPHVHFYYANLPDVEFGSVEINSDYPIPEESQGGFCLLVKAKAAVALPDQECSAYRSNSCCGDVCECELFVGATFPGGVCPE